MKHAAIFIISLLFLGSCISTKKIITKVYHPATLGFDSTVVNVLVVDNVPNSNSEMKQIFEMKLLNYPTDSAKWFFTESFTNFLNEEQYFGSVSTYPYVTRSDSAYNKDIPLTDSAIKEICAETNSDAIISIDQYVTTFNIKKVAFFPWANSATGDLLKVKMSVMMRAYTQDGRMMEPRVVEMDSLIWKETVRPSGWTIKVPDLQSAMKETAVYVADKMVNAYIPHWEKIYRNYYAGSSRKMKKAETEALNGNWMQAALYWKEIYDNEKKRNLKAQLALNIALANECLDDLDNAMEWINVALDNESGNKNESRYGLDKSKLRQKIEMYKSILDDQIINKNKLTEQTHEKFILLQKL